MNDPHLTVEIREHLSTIHALGYPNSRTRALLVRALAELDRTRPDPFRLKDRIPLTPVDTNQGHT
jgi:hypothetical protein